MKSSGLRRKAERSNDGTVLVPTDCADQLHIDEEEETFFFISRGLSVPKNLLLRCDKYTSFEDEAKPKTNEMGIRFQ